jgi:hypothetical protein
MATLATVYHRFIEKELRPRRAQNPAGAPAQAMAPVRAFANEDIYFHVKRIDNSRLVRQADPQAREACWKMIGSVGIAATLLIGVLLPSAYGLLAGYQIQALRQEATRLEAEQSTLELREVALLSPARMEELARQQQFVDPAPAKVVYLESGDDSAVAMNGTHPKTVGERTK